MQRRRGFLTAAVAASTLAGEALAQSQALACRPFDRARQEAVTPDLALAKLKAGNERFVAGTAYNCDLRTLVKATAAGQTPMAAVVGCIDSRVPPELVFDQRIGDIFAARIAGNFVNTDIIGSLEFATALAGAKLVVVLGHTECGAIKGAIDDARMGNLTATLANIRPSVLKVRATGMQGDSKDRKLVQAVADQNARDAADQLTTRSEVLAKLVSEGRLKIVSAMLDVSSGRITWFG